MQIIGVERMETFNLLFQSIDRETGLNPCLSLSDIEQEVSDVAIGLVPPWNAPLNNEGSGLHNINGENGGC